MNEKLKPCPFCGFDRLFIHAVEYDRCINIISCPNCNIEITMPTFVAGKKSNNRKRIIAAWNRRFEKESPLPVEYEGDGYDDNGELIYDTAYCPNCRNEYEVDYDYHDNYCRKCGQKLDWRSDNG